MSLLLCMSLCGTIFLLFTLCVDFLALKSVGARFVYKLYKLALLLFLLPFQYYKFHYLDFFRLFNRSTDTALSIVYYDNSENLSFVLGNRQYFYPRIWVLFSVISMVIFVIYITKQYRNYKKEICGLNLFSTPFCDLVFKEILQAQRSFSINHRGIALYQNPYIRSPFTIGILHPRIFLPCREYSEKERQFIYSHELFHIKNHDTLIKLISLLAIAVHWYNPFVYFLYWKINQLSEYACDENILESLSDEDRKFYGILLVQLSTSDHPNVGKDSVFGRSFSEHKNTLEKRLLTMKNFSPNKVIKKLLIPVTGLALLISGTVTVSAYSPAASMEDTISKPEPFSMQNNDFFFEPEGTVLDPSFNIDFSLSNQIFIDENGINYSASDSEISPQAYCVHSYVNGTINEHKKNSNGGCTITTYNAKRCSKCGYVVKGSYISSLSYEKCPH